MKKLFLTLSILGLLIIAALQPTEAGKMVIGLPPEVESGGGTTGGGYTPPSGNTLWLIAEDVDTPVDGTVVTTWSDSSGSGDHATSSGGARPTYETSIVNSLPVVRFDGSDDYLESACTDYGTVFAVISMRTLAANKSWIGALSSSGGAWDAYLIGTTANTDQMVSRIGLSGGGSAAEVVGGSATITAGAFFIWTFRQSGSLSIAQWKNGTAQGTYSAGSTPQGGLQNTVLGAGYYNDARVDFAQWDIAEVLIFDSALSTSDLNDVGDYLGDKYAITWNTIP